MAGAVPAVSSTTMLTAAPAPAWRRTRAGSKDSRAAVDGGKRTGPAGYDGGASAAAAPHAGLGLAPSAKSSRVTAGASRRLSHGRLVERPFTFSDWTYGVASDAPGARISMRRSSPRSMLTLVKRGLPRARTGVPGVSG